MGERTPYGAKRLMAEMLAVIDRRILICRHDLERRDGLPVVLQARDQAVMYELTLLRREMEALTAAGDRP